MRVVGLSLAVAMLAVSSSIAAPGDQWILGIHHIDQQGDKPFTAYNGAGYSGVQSSGAAQYAGNAYGYASTGPVGVNRVYWELSGNSVNNGAPVPNTPQLYKIEYFATTQGGHGSYQPVESQYHGIVGEGNDGSPANPSIDTHIPWAGQFGTNHQWISVGNFNDGQFHGMGPGPQTDTNAPADGTMMWLTSGSWLYAKWDFTFAVNRSWSALRLTQVTPVAGPPVTGDYNKNGAVDAADYTLWRKTYGSVGPNLPADGFPDGFIDDYDYDVWREAFGNHNGSGTGDLSSLGAVPEPAAVVLIAMAAAVFIAVPRRRAALAFCQNTSIRKRRCER